ncbi:ABC transporter permease [Dolosicoccus paucivorans]|uniref:ABC transporter permease n=1 Tax=Dolosicoccus paucivorans TaxID=84521 RepID=UPI0008815A7A|nr:ABC transporter permease [Dolosicoccus paucivorans]SDI62201.1 peptide/nickel transport system permease protein [Dolosicoccus paucivorans]
MEPNNQHLVEETELVQEEAAQTSSLPPMGFEVIRREFKRDKIAMAALIILVAILVFIFIAPFFMDIEEATKVNIFNRFTPSGQDGYLLGSDEGGRDILAQLIVGARNSIIIGWSVTMITSAIGIAIGIFSGYHGGLIDDITMRIIDFIMVLPTFIIIIVITTIITKYDMWTLIWVISLFGWASVARLFRTATLSEASKEYVSASKTMGTSDWKIMFGEVMPNLSSLIIAHLTLGFAGSIGIETGLSFLGFGLPIGTPSLGTLIGTAKSADIIENKTWVWLPAVILVLILMLTINYIGQALRRAADSRQRLG